MPPKQSQPFQDRYHAQPTGQDNPGQQPGPRPTPLTPQPVSPNQEYDFITNPGQPDTKQPLLGGKSMAVRAAIVSAGLLLIIIAVIFLRGLFASNSIYPSFVAIAQDQQELIHLLTTATEGEGLSTSNSNFASTALLSLTSSKSGVITYLTNNKQKVNPKVLELKVDSKADEQLAAAAAAATYNQTFQEIMKLKIAKYTQDLKQTYQKTEGQKGRELLNNDYLQAQLLIEQLNSATN